MQMILTKLHVIEKADLHCYRKFRKGYSLATSCCWFTNKISFVKKVKA